MVRILPASHLTLWSRKKWMLHLRSSTPCPLRSKTTNLDLQTKKYPFWRKNWKKPERKRLKKMSKSPKPQLKMQLVLLCSPKLVNQIQNIPKPLQKYQTKNKVIFKDYPRILWQVLYYLDHRQMKVKRAKILQSNKVHLSNNSQKKKDLSISKLKLVVI